MKIVIKPMWLNSLVLLSTRKIRIFIDFLRVLLCACQIVFTFSVDLIYVNTISLQKIQKLSEFIWFETIFIETTTYVYNFSPQFFQFWTFLILTVNAFLILRVTFLSFSIFLSLFWSQWLKYITNFRHNTSNQGIDRKGRKIDE